MRVRFSFLCAFASLFLCSFAFADTTWVAPGDVSGLWTHDGSPYMILGDLRVPPSENLSIGPGVTVFFAVRCSVLVDDSARIEALGAEGDSIYFTSDTLQLPERWGGIEIEPDADTCQFAWCVIENAVAYGINAWGAPLRMHASVLRYNRAGGEAGAIIHANDYLDLTNCTFQFNVASHGGALLLSESRGRIEDCIFRRNDGGGLGGAIDWFSQYDTLVLRRCDFIENSAAIGGAVALEATGSSFLRFEDCRFIGNTATQNGGAVSNQILGGGFTFVRCWFEENQAPEGGAMWVYPNGDGQAIIDQCVFTGNNATDGGAIYIPGNGGTPTIQRCTIVRNVATNEGGGIYVTSLGYVPTVYSTIIAFNAGAGLRMPTSSSSSHLKHNLLFGNLASDVIPLNSVIGTREAVNFNGDSCDLNFNLVFDPQLVDTAVTDYHLLATSPCIDAGPPWPWFPRDPDSTIADIGAFYYDQSQSAQDPPFIVHRSSLIAYPNPFNAVARIEFDLPRAGEVELTVFDITGRRVAELINQPLAAGSHNVNFDATALPSGVYFYHLRANDAAQTRKMVLLR